MDKALAYYEKSVRKSRQVFTLITRAFSQVEDKHHCGTDDKMRMALNIWRRVTMINYKYKLQLPTFHLL